MSWPRRLLGLAERKSFAHARPWARATGCGAEPPASYEGQVRAAMRNPVALRAVRLVAEGLQSVTLEAGEAGHPALELVTPSLLEGIATHLLLAGNAFVETGLDIGGRPAALWLLRPERMRLETDANGWPVSWAYQVGGKVQRLAAEGDYGRAQDTLDVVQGGTEPAMSLAFNARHVLDALGPIEGEAELLFSGSTSPAIFRAAGGGGYMAVMVTLRV